MRWRKFLIFSLVAVFLASSLSFALSQRHFIFHKTEISFEKSTKDLKLSFLRKHNNNVQDSSFEGELIEGHPNSEIYLNVSGEIKSLEQAINDQSLFKSKPGESPEEFWNEGSIQYGHFGSEILININGQEKSLQKALHDGDFYISDNFYLDSFVINYLTFDTGKGFQNKSLNLIDKGILNEQINISYYDFSNHNFVHLNKGDSTEVQNATVIQLNDYVIPKSALFSGFNYSIKQVYKIPKNKESFILQIILNTYPLSPRASSWKSNYFESFISNNKKRKSFIFSVNRIEDNLFNLTISCFYPLSSFKKESQLINLSHCTGDSCPNYKFEMPEWTRDYSCGGTFWSGGDTEKWKPTIYLNSTKDYYLFTVELKGIVIPTGSPASSCGYFCLYFDISTRGGAI